MVKRVLALILFCVAPIFAQQSTFVVLPNGEAITMSEGHTIFDDTFPGAAVDTNNWSAAVAAGGGVACSIVSNSGQLTCGSGTTPNGYSYELTAPTFKQLAPGFIQSLDAINLENPIAINAYRAWGFGNPQATPTAANPFIDALVYEITTAGKLQVAGYA